MRPNLSRALATVSLTALVTVATSSQALTPASLGTLKQLDKWKVGIVDPEGQSFCAMVNKFDKNFGLAFALSPEGYGSVAVDVTDSKFTPGDVYQVSLKTNGDKAGTYPGRATSERSVVVQVGQNKAFYDALKGNAALGVGLPALNVEFSLNKFAQSYRQLVDCSQTLVGNTGPAKMPAVQVKDVEKAPLESALAEISGESDEFQDANLTEDVKDKDALFDAVEAKAESNDSQARVQLASIEQQQQSVKAEIGAQKQKSAEIAAEKQQVERKLIASTKAASAAAAAPATGATAKLWDAEQGQQAQAQPAQSQPAQSQAEPVATVNAGEILWNDTETAAKAEQVEAEKSVAAAKQVEEYQKNKQALDSKAAALKTEAVKIEAVKTAAPDNKAARASLVAKQAELARVSQERVQQTQELTRKLSATQAEYEAKLAAITAERDALKANLASAQDAQKTNAARVSALQSQLDAAQAQSAAAQKTSAEKSKAEARIAELQAQLAAARAEADAAKTAAADKQAVIAQKAKAEAQVAQLKTELDAAQGKDAALQKTVAEKKQAEEKLAALEAEVAKANADKKALEERLAAAEKSGKELAARAKQMEAATGSDSKQLAAIKASLEAEKAAHEKDTAELRLKMQGQDAQFEELKATYVKLLDRSKQVTASANDTLAQKQKTLSDELARKDAYVSQLEAKLAVLESERSAAVTRADKAQDDVATVRRELQGLRKSLIVVNDDNKPAAALAAKKHAEALAAAEKEVNKAESELAEARTRISTLQSQLDTTREQVTELQKTAVKATTVAAAAQDDALKAKTKTLEEAQKEIARLKSNTTELEAKLFNATAEGKETAQQKAELAAAREKVAAAENEIARLKADNVALSGKLAETAQLAKIQPASGGDDMKLAAAQSRVESLERELADAKQAPVAAAEISADEMAAEPELAVSAPKPAKMKTAGAKEKASKKAPAPVQELASDDMSAPVVRAPHPARKPRHDRAVASLDVTRQITATREVTARDVSAIEPAAGAGDDMPVPTLSGSSNWMDRGTDKPARIAAAPVVQAERAQRARPVEMMPVVSAPVAQAAVVSEPLAPVVDFHPIGQARSATRTVAVAPARQVAVPVMPAAQKDPGFDENRAAAFLDRIMAHHRPAGAKPAVVRSYDSRPVFSTPRAAVVASPRSNDVASPRANAIPSRPAATASLARIETAAGAPSVAPRRLMARSHVEEDTSGFPAPVTAVPLNDGRLNAVPVRNPVAISGAGGIESILANAGISDAQFTSSGANTRQWTTGGLSGMYEHTATHGHSFGENAQGYIERYRNDCQSLNVNMGPVQQFPGGSFARADISCPVQGNSYTTSMVFWQDGGSFHAVLHSGFPSDGATVKSLGDSVAAAIGGSGGAMGASPVAVPASSPRFAIRKAEAMPEVEPQYRFNIRSESAAATYQPAASFGAQYGRPAYDQGYQDPASGDFETLVIE
ncbi:MAG TPA: hypothetical protein VEF76_02935 [Patescibacteria group bacterium]|nr:hypothetical protein [Patescibacteria group bacterium]